jgi:hypothetical protein
MLLMRVVNATDNATDNATNNATNDANNAKARLMIYIYIIAIFVLFF